MQYNDIHVGAPDELSMANSTMRNAVFHFPFSNIPLVIIIIIIVL